VMAGQGLNPHRLLSSGRRTSQPDPEIVNELPPMLPTVRS